MEINGRSLQAKKATADGYAVLETELPVLLTVTKDLNVPRMPSIEDVMNAYSAEITTWNADNLPVERNRIGIKGSPTRIKKVGTSELKNRQVEMIDGTVEEAVITLVSKLKARQLV